MKVKGSCTIEPSGSGSTVTYVIFTDLGGSIPSWISKGAQRDAAIEWLQVMQQRGEKKMQEKK